MSPADDGSTSRLLSLLPALFHEDERFKELLGPFAWILLGRNGPDPEEPGLEQAVDDLPRLFDPGRTPEEFLPWLAEWVALSLDPELETGVQRRLVASAVEFYRHRGTRGNLEELLELVTGGTVTVTEPAPTGLQLGVTASMGVDTYLGDATAHLFHVEVEIPEGDGSGEDARDRSRRIVTRFVDLEKPAHTTYRLVVRPVESDT